MHQPDDRWDAALDSVGAHRGDRFSVFADLVARYGEPGRCHHDFDHASEVVDVVLGLHSPGEDWAVAVLAGWFHDAVYDPTAPAGANEGASAVLAEQALGSLGASFTAIGTVCRLVCLTTQHRPRPGDRAGALLCDADLSILAADTERYATYVAGVRAEFAHVDDDSWRTGRRTVLRGLLDRPSIFHTIDGRTQWEAAARSNISAELADLG